VALRSRTAARPGVVLVIACLGVALSSLDLFIVNVALPQIAVDLHTGSLGTLSWVLNAYAIVFAALLVLAGRLADRAGRARGFLVGVAIFIVASACCAVSSDVGMLVAFRIVQATGAAVMVPTSLGLVLAVYPPERRSFAVRIWTAMSGLAAALGPVIGGLLVSASWRWVFLVNLPIGLVALAAGLRWLPDTPGHRGPLPDVLGSILLTGAVTSLTFGLVKSDDWGWSSTGVIGLLVVAVVLTAAFLRRSSRHHSPVLELDLLRVRTFAVASLSTLLFSVAFGAMLLSIVLWTQQGWGWSALKTGLAVAPGPLMVPILSLIAGPLIPRLGAGRVIALGSTVFGIGVAWWAISVSLHPDYARDVLGGMLVTGIGVGLTLPTLFATAAASLPPERFATGSAVVNMVRQIGFAVGVAVLVAIIGSPTSRHGLLLGFRHGWIMIAGVSVAAAASGLLLQPPVVPVPWSTSPLLAMIMTLASRRAGSRSACRAESVMITPGLGGGGGVWCPRACACCPAGAAAIRRSGG
jgi:EmrB/QacA subfamily drug resistance transporter